MVKPPFGGFKMKPRLKRPTRARNIVVFLLWAGLLIGILPLFQPKVGVEANLEKNCIIDGSSQLEAGLMFLQSNSLLPISSPSSPANQIKGKVRVVVTAYSSSPWETDDNPLVTAAGTMVRDGIVANNYLPIGTKIRIPELYGDKIFVVEDRMSWKKGDYQIDIWFPSYRAAKNFGAKKTYIEILES